MKFLALSLFTIIYLLFPVNIYAQDNQFALGIYPPILEIAADPPAKVEAAINIQNRSDSSQVLSIVLKEFTQDAASKGRINYIDRAGDFSSAIKGKIKIFDQNQEILKVELAPKEAKELKLKIDVDGTVPTGDYYFSVLFISIVDGVSQTRSATRTGGGIGTNVLLTIGKHVKTTGSIEEFSAPIFLSHGPVPFKILLQNRSSHYILPRGRISVYDMFGRDVGRVDILPQHILAGSSRYLTDYSPSAANGELVWREKFIFGIYTATAVVKLSDSGPTFTRSISFVALPFYLLFATSFFAFMLIGIWLRVQRKI